MRQRLVLWLCAGVPIAFYLWTLSGASYWLDGGEFVASAIELDIAHPPGHPLTALYGKAFSLLPFGPLAARVALGQAVAAGLSAVFVFRAARTTARALGVQLETALVPLGLLAAWLGVLGYAIWFQAIRPEVYALQACLLSLAMERLVLYASGRARGRGPLYAAAFAVGLGLSNHHLMAFFLFPALIVPALQATRSAGLRPVWLCAAFGALGLLVYAYLPLRAAQHPPANLGDPSTLERMAWVVSARVYARGMGRAFPQPLLERFADVGVVLCQQLLFVFVPLALLGAYASVRLQASRAVGLCLLLCALPVLCIRPWLGSVRGNPDSIAYLSAGLLAVAVLASAGVAALIVARAGGRAHVLERSGRAVWIGLLALLAFNLWKHAPEFSLADFHATDLFDEYRMRALPVRSVLVATTPQTVFRAYELNATEALRPDVALLPLPFLRYPGVAEAVVRKTPLLRELVAAALAREQLDPAALERVAQQRPLMIELDPHLPPSTYARVLPAGLLYTPVGAGAAEAMLAPAHALQQTLYARIEADLGVGRREVETARQLLWLHYTDALYYAARGEHEFALQALASGRVLFPDDVQLGALARALAQARARTPVDVRDLLEFDAGRRAQPNASQRE